MATCEGGFPKLIDSLLLEPLAPAKWQKLRAHLPSCASCRDRYNRVSLAERMLHGGKAAQGQPSPACFARIGAALFDGMSAQGPKLGGLARVPRWAFSVFALSVTAALLPFLLRTPMKGPSATAEFAVRGATTDPAQQAGVRAFCLKSQDGATAVQPLVGTTAQCATGDLLKLTYTNKEGYEDLFLFGVDAHYGIKWYEPRPPSTISIPAVRAVDQPLGGAIKVGVNHDPGAVRIYALFAHAPIAAREVEAAVDELKRRGAPLRDDAASTLPLGERSDLVQRSLLVEITK
ncbi:MAG: hypothetical protein EXR72_11695 [Myxococcales bacterium]|nr:hypothetical protein [Myxococcales bacterium]